MWRTERNYRMLIESIPVTNGMTVRDVIKPICAAFIVNYDYGIELTAVADENGKIVDNNGVVLEKQPLSVLVSSAMARNDVSYPVKIKGKSFLLTRSRFNFENATPAILSDAILQSGFFKDWKEDDGFGAYSYRRFKDHAADELLAIKKTCVDTVEYALDVKNNGVVYDYFKRDFDGDYHVTTNYPPFALEEIGVYKQSRKRIGRPFTVNWYFDGVYGDTMRFDSNGVCTKRLDNVPNYSRVKLSFVDTV